MKIWVLSISAGQNTFVSLCKLSARTLSVLIASTKAIWLGQGLGGTRGFLPSEPDMYSILCRRGLLDTVARLMRLLSELTRWQLLSEKTDVDCSATRRYCILGSSLPSYELSRRRRSKQEWDLPKADFSCTEKTKKLEIREKDCQEKDCQKIFGKRIPKIFGNPFFYQLFKIFGNPSRGSQKLH